MTELKRYRSDTRLYEYPNEYKLTDYYRHGSQTRHAYFIKPETDVYLCSDVDPVIERLKAENDLFKSALQDMRQIVEEASNWPIACADMFLTAEKALEQTLKESE